MTFSFSNRFPAFSAPANDLAAVLDPIRLKHHLPALAGAIFTTDALTEIGATGVRKAGTDIPVTIDDLWHLGSDTKAMTAALAGTFVAEGRLSWDAKVVSFFPGLADHVPPAMLDVTLAQVLRHEAGLTENLAWWDLSKNGPLPQQRETAARLALASPAYPPGAFHYANTDYVVAGSILEKLGGRPWEDLMRERLFQPLGMASAGFGGTGTPGQIDQPWPHLDGGKPAQSNGPLKDNPKIVGPSGTVHCTMGDWARFLVDQLRGAAGLPGFLRASAYGEMQSAAAGKDYGFGWHVTNRSWAGGKALTHAGSNTMNFSVCWLAPAKKFGVLVCTNQGGKQPAPACDQAAAALIRRYEATR